MGTGLDFLSYLGYDMSVKIFTRLDDPSDIARVSCVSHSWRDFVIANGLAKQSCLRTFPQLSRVDHVVEPASMAESPVAVGSSNIEWETLKKEHRAYAFLGRGFMSFPEKSIDIVGWRVSYGNPVFPIIVTYELEADFCVVTEFRIKTFEAVLLWQWGFYFAKSVRFRMGHLNPYYNDNLMDESCLDSLGDKFVWTYTSQEFSVVPEDLLQSFKLPEPVLCIGGRLQIELRGDGLFNFNGWAPHFDVVGRPLSPAFGVKILGPSGNFVLKALSYTQPLTVHQETRRAAERCPRWFINI
ncbi:hypothetical protein SLE2022_027450 [Rubroshorea leprosula]